MHIPFGVVAILFVIVVAPIWIVAHYGTRWRTARMLSGGQERQLADLHDLATRLEGRVDSLERILDADAPGWRERHGMAGTGPSGPFAGPSAGPDPSGPWNTVHREWAP